MDELRYLNKCNLTRDQYGMLYFEKINFYHKVHSTVDKIVYFTTFVLVLIRISN